MLGRHLSRYGSIVASASIKAPVGKEELTQEEFDVARFLSRSFYPFRVASFGEGFGVGTGITWAVPVSESVAVGLGGRFRYHGSYSPAVDQQAEYDPGEEGRPTGGIDVQLSSVSALSADVSYFLYGTDTVGGADRFDVGNQISVRVQYLQETEQRTIQVVGSYHQHEKSTLPLRASADRTLQILPTRGMLQVRYTVGLSERAGVRASATGRWYDEAAASESKTLGTIGVRPRFAVREKVSIAPRVVYTAGDIMGLEGGIGFTAQF